MATYIEAFVAYGPRLLHRPTVRMEELIKRLTGELDNLRVYKGQIENRENIGLSPEGYKTLWGADHPDDPLELAGIVEAAA